MLAPFLTAVTPCATAPAPYPARAHQSVGASGGGLRRAAVQQAVAASAGRGVLRGHPPANRTSCDRSAQPATIRRCSRSFGRPRPEGHRFSDGDRPTGGDQTYCSGPGGHHLFPPGARTASTAPRPPAVASWSRDVVGQLKHRRHRYTRHLPRRARAVPGAGSTVRTQCGAPPSPAPAWSTRGLVRLGSRGLAVGQGPRPPRRRRRTRGPDRGQVEGARRPRRRWPQAVHAQQGAATRGRRLE